MATSNSVDYTVTRSDIVNGAAEDIGVKAIGQALSSAYQNIIVSRLNQLVKQYQGTTDFAPGLKVWTRRRGTVFLEKSKVKYALGPSGDHATDSYVKATLTADSAALDDTLTVDSITGISDGDFAGVVLDDGTLYWTTVNGAPAGSTVTLTTGLTSLASSGKYCFFYTSKMRRPITILTQNLKTTTGLDIPMSQLDLYQYEGIHNKTAEGDPCSMLYEAQLTNGQLYVDYSPSDVSKVISIVYLSDVEDMDSTADNFDYPAAWYRALRTNLAVECAPAFGRSVSDELRITAASSLMIAQNLNPENYSGYFEPDA